MENIRTDPVHTFFPETIELDETRTPTIEQVEEWFHVSGFTEVSTETIRQQTDRSDFEVLEKAELKSTSVLTLLSQRAFNEGLDALQKYLSDNPEDPWLRMDQITLTTGKKSFASH